MERTDFVQWKAKEVARLLALVETERRYYQEMVAALPVPLVVLSAEHSVVWANRAFRRTFGLRAEDLRRKSIDQVLPVEGLTDSIQATHAAGTEPAAFSAEILGSPMRVIAIPIRNWDDEAGVETLLMIENLAEISAILEPAGATPAQTAFPEVSPGAEVPAKAAEEEPKNLRPVTVMPMAAAPSAVAGVPKSLPAVIWECDAASFEFATVSGFAEELLGYPVAHWTGRREFFEERIYADDRAATMALYRSAVESNGDASAEFRCVSASGDVFWCRETIRVEGSMIAGVLTRVGRRKQLEQQLMLAGRLEAIQDFSGRLAHGLNNPLMIVTGYGEDLAEHLPANSPAKSDVAEMLTATQRISSIALQLTELARKQANPPTRIDLSETITAAEARLARAAGEPTRIELLGRPGEMFVAADQAQLVTVLEALVDPRRPGADQRTRVSIRWETDTINERTAPAALAPGNYARVVIRDNGRGLEEHRQAAVFDPIPTGSAAAGAATTGNLLTRAYFLIRQWGGSIVFTSEFEHGSTFIVYLPLLEPVQPVGLVPVEAEAVAPVPEPIPEPAPEPEPEPEPQRETVLVVDDEAGIRGLMRKILLRENYHVLEAGTAEDALISAESFAKHIDLLLTDVVLPGMSGPELARKMVAEQPDLKVLYISGYTPDESVQAGQDPPGARFLAKPFTLGALLSKVRETLEA